MAKRIVAAIMDRAEGNESTCSHPKTVLHHTGDGAPVEFCPDCGRNVAIGNPPAKEGTTE